MGKLMLFSTLLAIVNLAILLFLNINNVVEEISRNKRHKELMAKLKELSEEMDKVIAESQNVEEE